MYRRPFTGGAVPWNGGAQVPSGQAQQRLQALSGGGGSRRISPAEVRARGLVPMGAPGMGAAPAVAYQEPQRVAVPPAPQPAAPQWRDYVPEEYRDWVQIPTWYTLTTELAGAAGSTANATEQTRPERFIPIRITYGTTEDIFLGNQSGAVDPSPPFVIQNSVAARSVRVSFRDEFTHFMGTRQGMVSALFGDSSGFLDFPKGILFQGKQTLYVECTRIVEIYEDFPGGVWDFIWHGVCLLPPGTQASGSQQG